MKKSNDKSELHKLDAKGVPLGRLASKIATLLQGKHRIDYAPNIDFPIRVEVSNVNEIKITGKKADQKLYYRYTGYPGGLKTVKMSEYIEKKPHVILVKAVQNMLPKNRLQSRRMRRLIFV